MRSVGQSLYWAPSGKNRSPDASLKNAKCNITRFEGTAWIQGIIFIIIKHYICRILLNSIVATIKTVIVNMNVIDQIENIDVWLISLYIIVSRHFGTSPEYKAIYRLFKYIHYLQKKLRN